MSYKKRNERFVSYKKRNCDACSNSSDLRVGLKTLLNTVQYILILMVCVEELGALGTTKLYHTKVITMLTLKYLEFTN